MALRRNLRHPPRPRRRLRRQLLGRPHRNNLGESSTHTLPIHSFTLSCFLLALILGHRLQNPSPLPPPPCNPPEIRAVRDPSQTGCIWKSPQMPVRRYRYLGSRHLWAPMRTRVSLAPSQVEGSPLPAWLIGRSEELADVLFFLIFFFLLFIRQLGRGSGRTMRVTTRMVRAPLQILRSV